MRLMREVGVNYVSITIFGWVNIQPNESTFDFTFGLAGWISLMSTIQA